MTKWPIGTWTCPSGNSVTVSIEADNGGGVRRVNCQWDTMPLSKRDRQHYQTVILPELVTRLTQYLELAPGRSMVVMDGE